MNIIFWIPKGKKRPAFLMSGELSDKTGIDSTLPIEIRCDNGRLEIKNADWDDETLKGKSLEEITDPHKIIKSCYDKDYKGYTVNLKLERNYDYEPVYISGPSDAYIFLSSLQHEPNEKFLSLNIDSDSKVVGVYQSAMGSVKSAYVSPYDIFKAAMLTNSDRIILAHNHPSGNAKPSKEDIDLTRKIYDAGKIMDIDILDHLVIGDGDYTSLKDKGYF